ncbi:MAG TPA: indole-3-glycerol phosphate synthase TrpC [Pyrinomonadaceae bacterium]|jgi:indole-3-glycerol phosphate synthase
MRASDFLTGIMEDKRKRVAEACGRTPLDVVRVEAAEVRRGSRPHALRDALGARRGRVNVIAEFKRASPSKGIIRADVRAEEMAQAYDVGGAAAISVLTEQDHFRGLLDDLRAVRRTVALPLLRKDFIFDEYQVYEAAAAGADALLLIVAALDDETLRRLRRLTEDELQMDALVEVHTADEMRRAGECGASVVGINNRNLSTFEVSLNVSRELAAHAPAGALLVSESGLRNGADLRSLRADGFHAFLIGESLMRSGNPADALRALLDEAEEK